MEATNLLLHPQFFEHSKQFLRQRCFDTDGLTSDWMKKGDGACMEPMSRQAGVSCGAVELIADDLMPQRGQMHPDLVPDAGHNLHFGDGKPWVSS